MENADRTIEMYAPTQEGKTASPPPPNNGRAQPVFPDVSEVMKTIPEGSKSKRPSPALDPIGRAMVSRAAKWIMLIGILLLVAWLPSFIFFKTKKLEYSVVVAVATMFAAVVSTGLPRILIPKLFGKYQEATEALRDWLIVGFITGILYLVFINLTGIFKFGPATVDAADLWMRFRLPLLLTAGVIGLLVARFLALKRDAVLGTNALGATAQIIIQVLLLGAFERPFEKWVATYSQIKGPAMSTTLGFLSFLCIAATLGIVTWAASADATLSSLKRRRGGTGVDDGTGPVNMTLTVIGGRESGKTVLLAGAFYEWSTQNIGNLRITPGIDAEDEARGMTREGIGLENLEDVARELYVNNQFPVGTVSTQDMPFDLSLGNERIARFSFLDYPGGAIAGRVADEKIVQEFWDRVEDTDGIVMIADMSYVRRAHKDKDWLEVRNAYRTVMQRLVDRNGKQRVVPVALVLTKCDEFVNPNTGHIDMVALRAGLKEFQYDELEEEWRRLNAQNGPGFAEFTTWITSAITYSQPQVGPDGLPDYSRPFMIAPPPPTITPTGCASPLLWMTAKVMRWNVTMFYEFSTFLFGSSPKVRRRIDAVLEMERIAEERSGKA
jgi:hypothetical protein